MSANGCQGRVYGPVDPESRRRVKGWSVGRVWVRELAVFDNPHCSTGKKHEAQDENGQGE